MPTDQERRDANLARIRHQTTHTFESLEEAVEGVQRTEGVRAVMVLPWSAGLGNVPMTPEQTKELAENPAAVVPITFRFWRWEIRHVFDCLDPNTLWVEADAIARTRLLDLDYRQRYVNFYQFDDDGETLSFKEYFDSDQVRCLMLERQHQYLVQQ